MTVDTLRFNSILAELDRRAHNSAHPFEKRVLETTTWFFKSEPHLPRDDLRKRLDFLTKYCECMIENLAWAIDRLQEKNGSKLWLPGGMNAHGDMTKFG